MRKITFYVHDEIEGATENAISKIITFLWNNNIEVVNAKQEIIGGNEIDYALSFESDEKGNIIK